MQNKIAGMYCESLKQMELQVPECVVGSLRVWQAAQPLCRSDGRP